MDGSGGFQWRRLLRATLTLLSFLFFAPLFTGGARRNSTLGSLNSAFRLPFGSFLPSDFLRLPLLSQGFLKSGMTTAFYRVLALT